MEKIIQIICNTSVKPVEWVVLTDKGRLFKRNTLEDKPDSQWTPVDLPDFKEQAPERKHKKTT